MPEIGIANAEIRRRFDTLSLFCCILKLPFERRYPRPNELPETFILDSQLLGELEPAILATMVDHRERSQNIFWDEISQLGLPERVFVGSTSSGSRIDSVKEMFRRHLGPKPLIRFHTHPRPSGPSYADIAIFLSTPRGAYFELIGTRRGIFALAQTDKTINLPVSENLQTLIERVRLTVEGITARGFDELATYCWRRGLGLYYWSAPHDPLRQGDLQNGIEFKKTLKRWW